MKKPNKGNKANKFNTLEEVIEALKSIDRKAALYLWSNFNEEDFQHGTVHFNGALRRDSRGPLDFFSWNNIHGVFPWYLLNSELKKIENIRGIASEALFLLFGDSNKINLNDYTTKDIDYTGCDPVIAKAIKQNKSIECSCQTSSYDEPFKKVMVDKYAGENEYMAGTNYYYNVEPIKKTKTELRVKDPVSVMQYLIDNGYVIDKSGFFQKGDERYCPRSLFAYCGCLAPEGWPLPELLEEVAVKCESDIDEMDDPDPYET